MSKEYVIISGAYGGLGKALAWVFAKKDYGIILLGRKEKALHILEEELSDYTHVKSVICDVSSWESCQSAYTKVKESGISVKILINNAGITYIQNFNQDYDINRYQELIHTNLNGSVYLTRLFLEDLLINNGTIITISSVIGYAPVLGRTAYAASKFGLEGFFSVLKAELGSRLPILMVYPTFIQTNIRDTIKGDKTVNEILTAEVVAQKTYDAFKKNKSKVYIGKTAKLSYYIYKYLPKLYVNLMRKKNETKA